MRVCRGKWCGARGDEQRNELATLPVLAPASHIFNTFWRSALFASQTAARAVGMGWKMDRNRLRETSYRQFIRRGYVIRIDET